jgi:excisionase family DNA binding protein
MILAEIVEGKKEALRVAEVARILDVSIKKIYRMAAQGQIPSLKISNSIRFDPHDIAVWLRSQSSTNPIPAVSLRSAAGPRLLPSASGVQGRTEFAGFVAWFCCSIDYSVFSCAPPKCEFSERFDEDLKIIKSVDLE